MRYIPELEMHFLEEHIDSEIIFKDDIFYEKITCKLTNRIFEYAISKSP